MSLRAAASLVVSPPSSSVGLNTSTAISLFVKPVLQEGCIPFELTPAAPNPFFSEENLGYVKKSVSELRAGKGTAHELNKADES